MSQRSSDITRRNFLNEASKSTVAPAAMLLFSAANIPTDVSAQYGDPSAKEKKAKKPKKPKKPK